MNKGVTTIEILVVMVIMVVTTAVALYSFPDFTQRVRVERAAREIAIKIRTAQQRTLSPKQVRKADGTMAVPRGFGIYLDTSLTGNTSYIFFADFDGNYFFNIAGGDVVIETVALPQGVTLSELKIASGFTLGAVNIVYTVPFSQTKIYDAGGAPILGDSLQVKLSRGADIVRFVTVRTTGLVTLGPAPQITAVADLTPPPLGDTCPGTNITNNPANAHWAWNDIIGWIDFCGGTSGNVVVAADKIKGYAVTFDTSDEMALDCLTSPVGDYCGTSSHGVKNDGSGVLSGWAWLGGPPGAPEASYGWVSFNCSNRNSCAFVPYQVTIDPVTGDFHGFAWNDIIGWISFNCEETGSCAASNYKVNTIWRPSGSQSLVNLKANASDGLTIPYNTSVIFTWNSQNVAPCTAIPVSSFNINNKYHTCWTPTASPAATSTQNFITGTKCSNLLETTTYTLNCTPNSGPPDVSDFVTVNVLPQPSVNIKADGLEGGPPSGIRADPIVISLNTSATLTWLTATGTVSCLASGDWLGSKALNNNTIGQSTGPQSAAITKTYNLDCLNVDGTTLTDWVKVRWQ